ncbi:NSFL1 cofactor p47 [Trichogramma pretiosum]|uniref:NSFL1 cofactor p47 n=1 Tax=Trichogramma pretiosum TaxID=7493 RepID=UPI000C71A38F|nr:NSFL1 cofactor p47 [Trichogramma pretiosum]
MDQNREDMIERFKDVTGVDSQRAKFFLESSAWSIDVALASFFENDSDAAFNMEEHDDQRPVLQNLSEMVTNEQVRPPMEPLVQAKASKSKPKKKANFGTIRDFKDNASSSDEEEGQAFYAGGSDSSGQQILGPGKKKDIISDMFKACKEEQGATAGESSRPSAQSRPSTFGGTGYKLGMTSNDTEVVGTPSSDDQASSSGAVSLKLWKNGFTVNNRELRRYDDPANQEFLDTIKRGVIPEEIRSEVAGSVLHLEMEDHRLEDYAPQKDKLKAFTGKGHMLGSPSPATVGMTLPVDPADQAANETMARTQLNLNTDLPVTSLQIRLADGSNVRAQFNLTHTIADVRNYIVNMRPQYALRPFTLNTTFPTKELSEEGKTIEELNLQNSAIMQRLK